MQEQLLDAAQTAQVLKVGKRKIYRLVRDKEIPSMCVGSSIRIPRSALDDWIRCKTATVKSEEKMMG